MLPALAVMGAGAGLSWWQKSEAHNSAVRLGRKQHKQNERMRAQAYAYERQAMDKRNSSRLKIWNHKLENYQLQQQWNADDAHSAFASSQRGINQQIIGSMFQSSALREELIKARGKVAASGSTSKSALLAEELDTLGVYGRNKAVQMQNLVGNIINFNDSVDEIAKQWYRADYNAWTEVAFAPEMETMAPFMSSQFISPEGPGIAAAVGSAIDGIKMGAPLISPSISKGGFANATFGDKIKATLSTIGGQSPYKN